MGRSGAEMAKQCNVNNGGCMHFCIVDKVYGAVCDCADGYRLALDSRTCEPTGTKIHLLYAIWIKSP